jgi:hypothetical protein
MDNPDKLATQGTQYEEKHNTIWVGHHYPQRAYWNYQSAVAGGISVY